MCFAPFDQLEERDVTISERGRFSDQMEQFSFTEIKNEMNDFSVLGQSLIPEEIIYNKDNKLEHSGIHELDLKRVYSINRHWMCGSCPHLFYNDFNGTSIYVKELFSLYPNKMNIEKFIIPKGINRFIIAELEDEKTFIELIKINGEIVVENLTLVKGESKFLEVTEFDVIEILGKYETNYLSRTIENLNYRNRVIGQFMKSLQV
jgi:hypothetical protein